MHPALIPPILGTVVALPGVTFAWMWLARRWEALAPPRRQLLAVALAVVEVIVLFNVYAWLIEPKLLTIRRITIESAQWTGPPLTIAALGDTHVGSPHVSERRMERVVRRINALRPDLVVLLGDYAGSHEPAAVRSQREQSEILQGIALFAALDARYGAVAVIGNHDSWYDRRAIAAELERAGVAVLWNRHVVIESGGQRFVVAGLADSDTGAPDYARAIDGAPTDADIIVIAHNPDVFVDIPAAPALTIAAHTHCGQVTIPPFGRLIVPSRYGQRFACGLIEEGGRKLFVTGGLGTSVLPVRFLNPPEIALITLRGTQPTSALAALQIPRLRHPGRPEGPIRDPEAIADPLGHGSRSARPG